MPRAQSNIAARPLNEMDLDAILLWHPEFAVVDELAHTNAPGSRHPKRYQDVLELLDAGIDVYTTLTSSTSRAGATRCSRSLVSSLGKPFPIRFSIRRRNRPHRSDTGTTPCATRRRQSLSGRARAVGRGKFLSRKQPYRAARDGISHRGRACRPRPARHHAGGKNTGPWKSGDRLFVAVRGARIRKS